MMHQDTYVYTYKNRKCPLDNKLCKIGFGDDDFGIDRSCRHGWWNNNIESPKCGLDLERKKKTVKPKSKRKCGCKK